MTRTPVKHQRLTPASSSPGVVQSDSRMPALRVADDDLRNLAEQLKVQTSGIAALDSELSQVAGQYIRRTQQTGMEASRAQSSSALKKVERQAEKLLIAIAGLDDNARFSFQLRLTVADAEPGYGIERLESLEGDISAIALAAKDASADYTRSGPKPDVGLLMTLSELAPIYECRTGRRATHLPSVDGTYVGALRSEADIFFKTFFDAIPRMLVTNLPDDGPALDLTTVTIPSATKLGGAIDRYLRDRSPRPDHYERRCKR